MSLYLNSVLFIDLYLSIKNPFISRSSRIKFYQFGCIVICLGQIYITIKNPLTLYINDAMDRAVNYFSYVMSVMTILPFFLVMIRLLKKGTSEKLKRLVIKRHAIYFLAYFVYLFDVSGMGISETIIYANFIGFFLALLRLFEPYVWKIFIYNVKLFCCLQKVKNT